MSIKKLTRKVKELIRLAATVEELLIRIISIIGWIMILISLFK